MRYLTYQYNSEIKSGVIDDNSQIYSFNDILGKDISMQSFIELRAKGQYGKEEITKLINAGGQSLKSRALEINDIKLKPPIYRPIREIICLGKNYEEHAKEIKATKISDSMVPSIPIYFAKSGFSVIGCGEGIPSHRGITEQIDYEVELAVIIGKECCNITEEEAESHIFGYTILNDISARDLQVNHTQWYRGKSLDGFCPIGPWITDDIEFPLNLNIRSRVNGELRQNSNTEKFIFSVPYVLSQLSQGMRLYPGDIIATGTPAGVGHGFNPPKNLVPGDIIECEIEGIGTLTNTVM